MWSVCCIYMLCNEAFVSHGSLKALTLQESSSSGLSNLVLKACQKKHFIFQLLIQRTTYSVATKRKQHSSNDNSNAIWRPHVTRPWHESYDKVKEKWRKKRFCLWRVIIVVIGNAKKKIGYHIKKKLLHLEMLVNSECTRKDRSAPPGGDRRERVHYEEFRLDKNALK